jgi:hypothetical protein
VIAVTGIAVGALQGAQIWFTKDIQQMKDDSLKSYEETVKIQARSEAAATSATFSIDKIREQLKSVPDVASITNNIANLVATLADTPGFRNAVVSKLGFQLSTGQRVFAKPLPNGLWEANDSCATGFSIIGYYCQVDSGVGNLQNVGLQGQNNFSCQWNSPRPSSNGNFSAWGIAVCMSQTAPSK